MHLVELSNLRSILGVLTALIAPAVLVSACGTFIISTSNRMALTTDRVRALAAQLRRLEGEEAAQTEVRRERLEHQLEWAFQRVLVQQRALMLFYSAAVFFVACSLALGMEALTQVLPNWLPVTLGLIGVLILLVACALLLLEARRLVAGMRDEMAALRADSRPAVRAPPAGPP